jgi:hypothetical protein
MTTPTVASPSAGFSETGKLRIGCAHAPVEQDHRQRRGADQVGELDITEQDASRSFLAQRHTDRQEHKKQWHTKARRHQAGEDAGQNDQEQHGKQIPTRRACPATTPEQDRRRRCWFA